MSSEPKVEPIPPDPVKTPVRRSRPSVPVLLRDLPLPPEIVPDVEAYCRKYRLRKARERQEVEEECKLQYYFGGDLVLVLDTLEGGKVVAAGELDSDEFTAQFEGLSPEVRREAVRCAPWPWDSDVSCMGLG
jgi:hypothetical protein